jgi:hypothetical protein
MPATIPGGCHYVNANRLNASAPSAGLYGLCFGKFWLSMGCFDPEAYFQHYYGDLHPDDSGYAGFVLLTGVAR